MAEWDDAPLAGQPSAPQAPAQPSIGGGSPWDAAPMAGPGPRAKAAVSANDDPEAAGRAANIAKQTGIPASIVQTDLPGYDAHAKTQSAIKAVQNPAIAQYIDRNPMAAKVSNDDYGYMDEVSQYFENLQQDKIASKASVGVLAGIPEVAGLLATAPGREKLFNALKQLPAALGEGLLDFFATPGKVASGDINLSTAEGLDKGIGFGVGIALGGRDIKFGRTAETPSVSSPGSVDDFLAKVRGMRTREEIDAFLKEKAGTDAGPILQIEHANAAGSALDKAVEVAQESKTKARSPDLFEAYIEAHGDSGSVHVPAQAILDLYEKAGKVPLPGDGLFGWVPSLADKAALAAETGAELKIPLAKYIANVDPTVHEGLKDVVRVQEQGVTREEAKALAGQTPVEEQPKLTQPMPEDNPVAQATVEQAIQEKKSLYLEPLIKDGETLGITQPEFKRYSDLIDKGQEQVLARAVALAAKEKAKRLAPEWKANEARVAKAVDGLVFNRPDFAADRFFNQGLMQDGKPVPKELRVKQSEVSADEYAPLFGFETGSEMTRAVLALEEERKALGIGPKAQFDRHVKAETAKQMEATYGNLADNIALEASEVALSEYNVDLLSSEWKMLAKLNGAEPPIGREGIESFVQKQFNQLTAGEVSYEQWRRAAEKGGREAEKALLKKDYVEALAAKQRQMTAFLVARHAKAFEKEVDTFNRMVSRIQDNPVLSNVEQEYTDQLHRLLDQLGFKIPRAPTELDSALEGKPFDAFIAEKEGAGQEMPVSPILQTGRPVDFDRLSVDDFRAVSDSITSILHNGREAKTIRVGNEKRDRVQTIAEAVNAVSDIDPKVIEREPGLLADLRSNLTAFDSMMLKMEQLLRWMDKRDKFGVYSQTAFRPLVEAKHVKNDLLKEMGQDIKAIKEDKAWRKALDTEIPNTYPSITDWQTGEPMKLRRKDLMMMILHSGNESNYGKLTSKYNYNGKDFQWSPADVDQLIKDHATKQDWDHAQGWWDLFEKYWPRVEDLSRRMSGIAPDKIQGRSITNDFGTYRGGYVPVGADFLWPGLKKVEQGVFNSDRYFNAIPPKGYTKSRTEVGYPVSLSFDNLTNTMYQMAHDLAFREPLTNAAKFLDDPEVRGAIQRVLGPEYLRQVRPWLEFQASAKRISDESVSAMDNMARMARQRIVAVQLLYRASTIMKHGAAAALYSVGEVGLKNMIGETMRLWGTADGRVRVGQILEESGELRHRLHDMDRDLGEIQEQNLGKNTAKAAFYHWGGMGTSLFDLGTAIPTYEVAKKQALLEGKSEADAVYAGEAAVRDAHGSSGITDQAPILRAGEVYKLFTIAYGTFNHNYNRLRDAGRLFKEAGEDFAAGERMDAWDKFQTAAYRSLWYVFLVAMVEEAIQPIPSKDGEKHGLIGWTAQALFHQLAGTIPVAREAARSYLYGRNDSGQTPMGQIIQSVEQGGKSLWEHDFEKKNRVRQAIEGTAYLLKAPGGGQLSQTLQYLVDLKSGRQSGENPYRFGRGIAMGKSHPERK